MRSARVPLAWRSITHDKKRFVFSVSGITFASLLMFMQMGFLNAVFDSQVELLRRLNADIIITNTSKHQMGELEPFSARRLEQARSVNGVEAASPLYIEGKAFWKNPQTYELHRVRAIGISPRDLAFLGIPPAPDLNEVGTVLIDRQSKVFFGPRRVGVRTELSGQKAKVVGLFDLGTDFDFNGTVIMSDASFLKFFPGDRTADDRARMELGLVRVSPGNVQTVQSALARALPGDVRVWTKDELIAQEVFYWRVFSPIGFIFGLGLAVGFVVGIVICSQILYTSVVDRMPLFGTLKAIGFTDRYLTTLVLPEGLLFAAIGFIPSIGLAAALYRALEGIVGFKMTLSAPRILLVMLCVVGMSLSAAWIAIRKATTADPAEVFK